MNSEHGSQFIVGQKHVNQGLNYSDNLSNICAFKTLPRSTLWSVPCSPPHPRAGGEEIVKIKHAHHLKEPSPIGFWTPYKKVSISQERKSRHKENNPGRQRWPSLASKPGSLTSGLNPPPCTSKPSCVYYIRACLLGY